MPEKTFTKEADVKAEVKRLLDKHRWFWWMPAANGYGSSGISDFLALRDGLLLAIETKFDGRKPTALQKAFGQSILAHDGIAMVVDETTIGALATWLGEFDTAASSVAAGEKVDPRTGAGMLDALHLLTQPLVAAEPKA